MINLAELMKTGSQRILIKETEINYLNSVLDELEATLDQKVYAWGLEEVNGNTVIEIVKLTSDKNVWYLIEWFDEDGDVRHSEVRADYYADKWVIANNYPSHNIVKELDKPSKQNIR